MKPLLTQIDKRGNVIISIREWQMINDRVHFLERKVALILDRMGVYYDAVPAHDVLIDKEEGEK